MATKEEKRPLVPQPPESVFSGDVWTTYDVTLSFTGYIFGGSPFDPKLVEGWIGKKVGITDEEEMKVWMKKHLAETQGLDPNEVTDAAIERAIEENAMEKKAQGFKKMPETLSPYIEGRHVKAMIKESTNIAFPQGEHRWGKYKNTQGKEVGGKSPLSYVAERVWVPEQPIVVAEEISGVEFAVGHIEDWKGRRSTIGYFEYCEKPTVSFQVKVLDDCLSLEQWGRIWQVAEGNGLGARRSQGGGQFLVTKWETIG